MKAIDRIKRIVAKIELVEQIVTEYSGKISVALQDELKSKPAILMHIVSVAEQMKKIEDEQNTEILKYFEEADLRGLADVRNFIAHDYDGVDLGIVENSIRYGLTTLKSVCNTILSQNGGSEK
jgi:uncharacterized protein with HEPN domain